MKLIILSGPPASSKSSWVKSYLEQLPKQKREKTIVVSRDTIRLSTGTYWVPERENYISNLEDNAMRQALASGFDVINDATNLNPKTIEHLKTIANEYSVEIEFKSFYVPFKEAVARDKQRGLEGGLEVTEPVIKSFYKRYFPKQYAAEEYIDNRIIEELSNDKTFAIICDLDGTIALHTSGRSPFDYERVLEDTPNMSLVTLLQVLEKTEIELIFLTGREESCRQLTSEWLNQYFSKYTLLMRENGSKISAQIFKENTYLQKIKPNYSILSVFEDSNKCVKMWRNNKLNCCQVWNNEY